METMEDTRQGFPVPPRERSPASHDSPHAARPVGSGVNTSGTRSQATRSDVLPPPRRKIDGALPLARGLGWFSIGLGLAELVAPRQLARFIGVRGNTMLIQAMGVREIAAGIGILTQRRPSGWMWARVAGDAVDLSLLGAATRQTTSDNRRIAMAATAVAGVTALDFVCSRKLSQARTDDAEATDGQINVQKTMAINRPAEELYSYWRDFENLPSFMKHLKSVTTRDARSSHWVATGPAATTVEWDAEVTEDRPNELIAWRSLADADVQNSGVVRFVPEPAGRGTIVRVEMKYSPPAGVVGAVVAKLFGEEPEQQVQEDLRRFKRFMETGEFPTTEGQSAGSRGAIYRLLKKGNNP